MTPALLFVYVLMFWFGHGGSPKLIFQTFLLLSRHVESDFFCPAGHCVVSIQSWWFQTLGFSSKRVRDFIVFGLFRCFGRTFPWGESKWIGFLLFFQACPARTRWCVLCMSISEAWRPQRFVFSLSSSWVLNTLRKRNQANLCSKVTLWFGFAQLPWCQMKCSY